MAKNRNRNRSGRNGSGVDLLPEADRPQVAIGGPVTERIGIEPPPDHIFKFRKNRSAPAQEVWGEGSITYIPTHAEYIKGKGAFVHYRGTKFPSATVAPVEAIYSVNAIKRILINSLRLLSSREMILPLLSLMLIGKKRRGKILTDACAYFNHISDVFMAPWYLETGYYCKLAVEVQVALRTLLENLGVDPSVAEKTAEVISTMFEYDNAYRYRVEDLAGETTKENLLQDFPREFERLLLIEESRENLAARGKVNDMTDKFRKAAYILNLMWKVPSLRKVIKRTIESVNLDNCSMDEAEIYHTLLYGDYNTKGRTLEERYQIYAGYHGPDPEKWPPRIMIRQR